MSEPEQSPPPTPPPSSPDPSTPLNLEAEEEVGEAADASKEADVAATEAEEEMEAGEEVPASPDSYVIERIHLCCSGECILAFRVILMHKLRLLCFP